MREAKELWRFNYCQCGNPKSKEAVKCSECHFKYDKHNSLKHGESCVESVTPEYLTWCAMKQRVRKASSSHKDYFDRGIGIASEFVNDYMAWLNEVGRKPSPKHSLDRINNELGYVSGNMRWATVSQQNSNRRKYRKAS